jgi:hypothetical protein
MLKSLFNAVNLSLESLGLEATFFGFTVTRNIFNISTDGKSQKFLHESEDGSHLGPV